MFCFLVKDGRVTKGRQKLEENRGLSQRGAGEAAEADLGRFSSDKRMDLFHILTNLSQVRGDLRRVKTMDQHFVQFSLK